MPDQIVIRGRPFDIRTVRGQVADSSKHLETVVRGGGGGGINGTVAVASVRSHTVVHDQVFLIDASGQEHAIKLTDWDLACRPSHLLAVAWLVKQGAASGACVAVANETTGETRVNREAIARLYRPSLWWVPALPALCIALSWPVAFWLTLIGGLVGRMWAGKHGAAKLLSSGAILPGMVSPQLR